MPCMDYAVTKSATEMQAVFVAVPSNALEAPFGYVSLMATKGPIRRHLYIDEWMAERRLSDEMVAAKLGVSRETVWRWSVEQHRLNPEKMLRLAQVLDIDPPQLYYPPARPSIDAILSGMDQETYDAAFDIVARLVKRSR